MKAHEGIKKKTKQANGDLIWRPLFHFHRSRNIFSLCHTVRNIYIQTSFLAYLNNSEVLILFSTPKITFL